MRIVLTEKGLDWLNDYSASPDSFERSEFKQEVFDSIRSNNLEISKLSDINRFSGKYAIVLRTALMNDELDIVD